MNKTDLSALIDVTPKAIQEFEAGRLSPGVETLAKLASVLNFPESFFTQPEMGAPARASVSFRSLTSLKASQRDAALGAGAIAFALEEWIARRFKLPDCNVPDMREMRPEDAANALRERWGLGIRPIRSVVHLLELHGVRVFSLAEQSRELDAFSVWNDAPFCFLNTMKSVEHSRFDAAHELGHLVLHRHGHAHGRIAEQEANEFASAFLMPRSTVLSRVPNAAPLTRLLELKTHWGVSVAALAHRSHRVGILTDWHYRTLCIEMAKRRYRTNEPQPMAARETSQVLNKVFASLRDDGVTKATVARELHLFAGDLDAIVFGLVMTGVPGSQSKAAASTEKPNLRLVK
jgi:Zn-dependent peptidase ImmA (M78 family)/DNA-binding XRE family transcriptional regulator